MVVERTYNVPLRREFLKAPRYRRAKTAVNALRRFLQKHMKSEEVFIGKRLNEKIWERGIRNPPHHVNITVVKEDDGKVYAELVGFKYEKPLTEEELKKLEKEKKKEEKKPEEKAEEKKEEKKEAKEEKKKIEKPKEVKKSEEKLEKEFKKLEEKTEKIKEEKAKKGEEKEKELEKLSKKVEKKPAKDTSEAKEKKEKEHPANA